MVWSPKRLALISLLVLVPAAAIVAVLTSATRPGDEELLARRRAAAVGQLRSIARDLERPGPGTQPWERYQRDVMAPLARRAWRSLESGSGLDEPVLFNCSIVRVRRDGRAKMVAVFDYTDASHSADSVEFDFGNGRKFTVEAFQDGAVISGGENSAYRNSGIELVAWRDAGPTTRAASGDAPIVRFPTELLSDRTQAMVRLRNGRTSNWVVVFIERE